MNFTSQNNFESGFSTLELMIAMTLLVLALSAAILVSFGGQSLIVDGQTNKEALGIAQSLLEEQQALARKDFNLVNATSTDEGIYHADVSVKQTDLFTKLVNVAVRWTGEYNRPQTAELSALVTNFNNAVGGDTCSSILSESDGSHGNWLSPIHTSKSLGEIVGDASVNYNISDVEAYNKKLYVTVNNSSLSAGANDAGSVVDDSSAGTIAWAGSDNAKSVNGSNATAALAGTTATHYLIAANFGFSIPASATILGIKVEITRSRTGGTAGGVRDSEVRIVKPDGSMSGENKAELSAWPVSPAPQSYGSSSDLWNETSLQVSDINNPNFGVVISAAGSNASTNRVANIDGIRMTVAYTRSFYVFDIADPLNPVLAGRLGSDPGVGAGFNAVATDGKYAYIATNSSDRQFQIIDLGINPPQVKAALSMPGVTGKAGNSIFYKEGYVYLGLKNSGSGSGPDFHIIDAHNPSGPFEVGSWTVGANVNAISVRGGYAYLATSDNSKELAIVNVADPVNPGPVPPDPPVIYDAVPDVANWGYGKSLCQIGNTLYFGRTYIHGAPEFSILEATNPSADIADPSDARKFDVGTDNAHPFSIDGMVIRNNLAFLLTGSETKGGGLKILDIANPDAIAEYSAVDFSSNGFGGIALDCEGNYLYAAANDDSKKGYITIITGQ